MTFDNDFDARTMLPNLTSYPTRDQWLEARVGKLTSSTSAKFGVGKMSGYRLNLQMRGLLERKAIDLHPDALEWGHRIEPLVLQKLRDDYPDLMICDPGDALCIHPDYPWLADSPDFYALHPDFPGIGAGEIKSVQRFRRDDWLPEGDRGPCVVPDYPLAQLQHHCLCSGAKWGIVAMFTGSGWDARFHSEFVWRDDEWLESRYLPDLKRMWASIEANEDWPEVDGWDARDALQELHGQHTDGKRIELGAAALEAHQLKAAVDLQLDRHKQRVKQLEEQKETAKNRIREIMADAEYGVLDGIGTYRWKTGKRGRRLTFSQWKGGK